MSRNRERVTAADLHIQLAKEKAKLERRIEAVQELQERLTLAKSIRVSMQDDGRNRTLSFSIPDTLFLKRNKITQEELTQVLDVILGGVRDRMRQAMAEATVRF